MRRTPFEHPSSYAEIRDVERVLPPALVAILVPSEETFSYEVRSLVELQRDAEGPLVRALAASPCHQTLLSLNLQYGNRCWAVSTPSYAKFLAGQFPAALADWLSSKPNSVKVFVVPGVDYHRAQMEFLARENKRLNLRIRNLLLAGLGT